MPAPSAAVIARVGAQYAALTLPATATITRPTRTANDSGGWTEGSTTVATVAARLAPAGGAGERDDAGRLLVTDQWWLTFAAGTDVRTGDVVTISGRTFHVQAPDGARSFEITRRVVANEAT
jgi:hypothetical protein